MCRTRFYVYLLLVCIASHLATEAEAASHCMHSRRSRTCTPQYYVRPACYVPITCCTPSPSSCSLPANSKHNVVTPTPEDNNNKKVHLLFLVSTTDRYVAKQVVNSSKAVRELFDRDGLSGRIGSEKLLTGKNCSPEQILSACEKIQSDANDTIFIYYQGHGGVRDDQHHLLPLLARNENKEVVAGSDVGIARSAIMDVLKKKDFRFLCFISDSCSEIVPRHLPAPTTTPRPRKIDPFVSLILDSQGIVDVNSSTYDKNRGIEERAWINADGGLFTQALSLSLTLVQDNNNDGRIDWMREYLPVVARTTNSAFEELKKDPETLAGNLSILNQPAQTVQIFPHN